MGRTAESTVKGFLYQFNKTLSEVLLANEGQQVTVEGLIEDIDIEDRNGAISSIQCKYHEGAEKFTPSVIYKPLLQMAHHASLNTDLDVTYKIFVHIPEETRETRSISLEELNAALETKNEALARISSKISNELNKERFLAKLILEFGPSLEELVLSVKENISRLDIQNSDVDSVLYPNAITIIAQMAASKVVAERQISLSILRERLRTINDTAVNTWTIALLGKERLLKNKRAQLRGALNQNSRKRYFYISKDRLSDFEDGIVIFIVEFLNKYHFKPAHLQTPIFALNISSDEIIEVEERLFKKGIKAWKGIVGRTFDEGLFFKDPIRNSSKGEQSREFDVRLVSFLERPEILNLKKCDDLYVVADEVPSILDSSDINVVLVGTDSFSELSYVLGMGESYE